MHLSTFSGDPNYQIILMLFYWTGDQRSKMKMQNDNERREKVVDDMRLHIGHGNTVRGLV